MICLAQFSYANDIGLCVEQIETISLIRQTRGGQKLGQVFTEWVHRSCRCDAALLNSFIVCFMTS